MSIGRKNCQPTKANTNNNKLRQPCGNMLVLVIAVSAAIVIPLLLFVLGLVRFLGSNQEQTTAIQAAALAAANDLEKIVVEDPDVGFVSITDYAPRGNALQAGDKFAAPVIGINTLLARARLDAIIADRFQDGTMKALAKLDYEAAMRAKNRLIAELKNVIDNDQQGHDIDGNSFNVLEDATRAYEQNTIRLSAGKNALVPGSMKLTLGCVKGLTTNTKIPSPSTYSDLLPDQQRNQFYKAYTNAKYSQFDFIFAGIGNATKLVDGSKFEAQPDGLPYFIPTIIKCEADQAYNTGYGAERTAVRKVHAIASAMPGSSTDSRPAPGILSIAFPQEKMLKAGSLYSIITDSQISKPPADFSKSPRDGDYPPSPLSNLHLPVFDTNYPDHPPFGHWVRLGLYDWIRRGGPNVNIDSLFRAVKQTLNDIPKGKAAHFQFKTDGTIERIIRDVPVTPVYPASHNQVYTITGLISDSNKFEYDITLRDFVRQPGRIKGGIHAGEPFPFENLPATPASTSTNLEEDPDTFAKFPLGTGADVVRPTYLKNGIAVELRFRRR